MKMSRNQLKSNLSSTDRCGDFPGGPVVKNPPANAGDMGLIPGLKSNIPYATGQ